MSKFVDKLAGALGFSAAEDEYDEYEEKEYLKKSVKRGFDYEEEDDDEYEERDFPKKSVKRGYAYEDDDEEYGVQFKKRR